MAAQLPNVKQVAVTDYDKAFAVPDLDLTQTSTGDGNWFSDLGVRLTANQYGSEQSAALNRMFGNQTSDEPLYGKLPKGLTGYVDKLVGEL